MIDRAKIVDDFDQKLARLSLEERIFLIAERFAHSVFITRFSQMDQYLAWALLAHKGKIDILSLPDLPGPDLLEVEKTLRQLTYERYGLIIDKSPLDMDELSQRYDVLMTSHIACDDENRPAFAEWDKNLKILKLNPMADLLPARLREAIAAHEIPVHLAHCGLSSSKQDEYAAKALMLSATNLPDPCRELSL